MWTQSSSAVVSAFAYALILSLMSWVATCFGYVDKPKGRYFYLGHSFSCTGSAVLWGRGLNVY